ncbi:MAG TPA: nucleotidyltransferase family protein [Verrucomicrobiae bacterium]|nr:nucleotidyltransferase family protein [Verrucomicrobiae bacterium]
MNLEASRVPAVILAGGFGTRVRHLLPDLPKPMAPVAGKPFLEWVIRFLAAQGLRQVVLSTGYKSELVEEHFREHRINKMQISCVAETEPLGTAGGFLNAVKATGEKPSAWLVVNGDSLVFADLCTMFEKLANPACAGVVVGRSVPDTSRFGSLACDANGRLLQFAEKRSGAGTVNGGIYLLRDSLLAEFPPQSPLSFETEVFPLLIEQGEWLEVISSNAPFLDIGTPETLPQAEQFVAQNRRYFAMN